MDIDGLIEHIDALEIADLGGIEYILKDDLMNLLEEIREKYDIERLVSEQLESYE